MKTGSNKDMFKQLNTEMILARRLMHVKNKQSM